MKRRLLDARVVSTILFGMVTAFVLPGQAATISVEQARKVLKQLPGFADLSNQSLTFTQQDNAIKLAFRGQEAVEAYLFDTGNNNWVAAVIHNQPGNVVYESLYSKFEEDIGKIRLTKLVLAVSLKGVNNIDVNTLPQPIAQQLQSFATKDRLSFFRGVSLFGEATIQGGVGALGKVTDAIGASGRPARITGSQDDALLKRIFKRVDKSGLPAGFKPFFSPYTLQVELPSAVPPALGKLVSPNTLALSFNSTVIEVRRQGQAYTIGGTQDVTVTVLGQDYQFVNTIEGVKERNTYVITASGLSKRSWRKVFGVQGLDFADLRLGISLDGQTSAKQARTGQTAGAAPSASGASGASQSQLNGIGVSIGTRVTLGRQKLDVDLELVVSPTGGGAEVAFVLTPESGSMSLDKVPGLNRIPGIGEFAFNSLLLSAGTPRAALSGELTWTTKQITMSSAIVLGGTPMVMAQIQNFSIGKIVPRLKNTLIDSVSMPSGLMIIKMAARAQAGPLIVSELPDVAQRMIHAIGMQTNAQIELTDGVNVFGSFDISKLSGALRQGMNELGIASVAKQPLILGGSLGGVFSGAPKVQLFAKLPTVPFPRQMPKFLSFAQGVDTRLFMRVEITGGNPTLAMGVSGGLLLKIGASGSETVRFAADAIVDVSASGQGFSVAGSIDRWDAPFGLKGLIYEDVAIKVGVDADTSVSLGLQGTTLVKRKLYKLGVLANLNVATLGMPKEIFFEVEADSIGLESITDLGDLWFKAIAGGPLKNAVPSQQARDVLTELGKGNLYRRFQLNKLPQITISGVNNKPATIYLATPGASDPSIGIDGMGVRVRGSLDALGLQGLAQVDLSLDTLGLKIFADTSIRQIGPLELDEAKIDIAANLNEAPRFIIRSKTRYLGIERDLDIEATSTGFLFSLQDKIGNLWDADVVAQTKGNSLATVRDFTVDATFQSGFGVWMRDSVTGSLNQSFAGTDKLLTGAQTNLTQKVGNLKGLDTQINRARDNARKKLANLQRVAQAAQNQLKLLRDRLTRVNNRKAANDKFWKDNWSNPTKAQELSRRAMESTRLIVEKAELLTQIAALVVTEKGLRAGATNFPIDLDPVVAPLIAQRRFAAAALEAAHAEVAGLQALNAQGQKLVDDAVSATNFEITKAVYKSGVADMIAGADGTLDVTVKVRGKSTNVTLTFNPFKPVQQAAMALQPAVALVMKPLDQRRQAVASAAAKNAPSATPLTGGGWAFTSVKLSSSRFKGCAHSLEGRKRGGKIGMGDCSTKDGVWEVVASKKGPGQISFKNMVSNFCLNGVAKVWTCDERDDQLFAIEIRENGSMVLRNRSSSRCLRGVDRGRQLIYDNCTWTYADRQWHMLPVTTADYAKLK